MATLAEILKASKEKREALATATAPQPQTPATVQTIKPLQSKELAVTVQKNELTIKDKQELLTNASSPEDFDALLDIPLEGTGVITTEEELEKEFQDEAQADRFSSEDMQSIGNHLAILQANMDDINTVRSQLTAIMAELKDNPETAAKLAATDIHSMVLAVRRNYEGIAFIKKDNKVKKDTAQSKALAKSKALLDSMGFDLDF